MANLSIKDKIAPGAELYDAVLGAFKASGTAFIPWCRENEITRENARSALHGVWRGKKGEAMLNRIVDAAGRETVLFLLEQRRRQRDVA